MLFGVLSGEEGVRTTCNSCQEYRKIQELLTPLTRGIGHPRNTPWRCFELDCSNEREEKTYLESIWPKSSWFAGSRASSFDVVPWAFILLYPSFLLIPLSLGKKEEKCLSQAINTARFMESLPIVYPAFDINSSFTRTRWLRVSEDGPSWIQEFRRTPGWPNEHSTLRTTLYTRTFKAQIQKKGKERRLQDKPKTVETQNEGRTGQQKALRDSSSYG